MLQYQLNMQYTFIILGIKTERKRKRCPALPVFPSRSPRQLRSRIFSYKYRNCHYLYMVELGASFSLIHSFTSAIIGYMKSALHLKSKIGQPVVFYMTKNHNILCSLVTFRAKPMKSWRRI